ncbi:MULTISPECIES: carbohydrate ABC transporter permease [Rhodoluna]|jgi:multiple sugar transport system permease protein|uniref:carbohydrate ABC transporter permease n=1 Tax=Rhodoluna TaxID=529883 RepID=UPI001FE4FCD8|nr:MULTISPECIES: carbohydrate ABC transporter permease [Rhodoluna]BDS49303.1 sugar ABC transporter permease [Rhodoluna sp. KAS3]
MSLLKLKAKSMREQPDEVQSQSVPARVVGYVLLGITVLATLFPIYWMLRTALSTTKTLFSDPFSLLPVNFTWGGFERVLGLASNADALAEGGSGADINFGQYAINSVIVCTVVTVSQVLFSAAAAYAFSILKFRGRDALFFVFLISMTVPGIFLVLPNYLLIRELGLLNTLLGVMLPNLLMSPFAIFFLRQFFLGTNLSIIEAAIIDGASHIRIFFKIVAPLAWPQIITLAILQFINYWNDYLWPFYVGSGKPSSTVLTVGLGVFKSQTPQGSPDWGGLMAGALVAAIPMVLLMIFFGKKIVGSIQASGVK